MSESAPRFDVGDVVVHKNYGVGEIIYVPGSSPQTAKDPRVTSTRKVTTKPQLKATQGLLADAIKLKFSDGDVFVPLDQINVLTLYCKSSDKDTKKSLKYSSIKDNTKWRDTGATPTKLRTKSFERLQKGVLACRRWDAEFVSGTSVTSQPHVRPLTKDVRVSSSQMENPNGSATLLSWRASAPRPTRARGA